MLNFHLLARTVALMLGFVFFAGDDVVFVWAAMRSISGFARYATGQSLGPDLWREHVGQHRWRHANGLRADSALTCFNAALFVARRSVG